MNGTKRNVSKTEKEEVCFDSEFCYSFETMRIENREFLFCFQVWQRVLVIYCSVSDSGVNAGDRKYRERIVGNEIKMCQLHKILCRVSVFLFFPFWGRRTF